MTELSLYMDDRQETIALSEEDRNLIQSLISFVVPKSPKRLRWKSP